MTTSTKKKVTKPKKVKRIISNEVRVIEVAKVGRPTVVNENVLLKLEQAASLDATVEEMCFYGGIGTNTYYEYLKKNPEFQDRINLLRTRPVLSARQSVLRHMENDGRLALAYLERRASKEFSPKLEVAQEDNVTIVWDIEDDKELDD